MLDCILEKLCAKSNYKRKVSVRTCLVTERGEHHHVPATARFPVISSKCGIYLLSDKPAPPLSLLDQQKQVGHMSDLLNISHICS